MRGQFHQNKDECDQQRDPRVCDRVQVESEKSRTEPGIAQPTRHHAEAQE